MLNLLIVDDIDIPSITKDIIQKNGVILKNKCHIKAYQFASVLPKSFVKEYKMDDVAINGIKNDEQYDIAFLDLEFTKEESELNQKYNPISDFITVLRKYHPYCEIIIVSADQNARGVHWDYSPKFSETRYISIPKTTNRVTVEEINQAILKCLERRLQHLLIECQQSELNLIREYFLNSLSNFDFKVANSNYKATPAKLFFQYFDDQGNIEKSVVFEKLSELVYDLPKLDSDSWTKSAPPKIKKDSAIIRRYPLKDYYYFYYRYFSSVERYSLETIVSNVEYSIQAIIKFIDKNSRETQRDVCEAFKNFPETIYRSLKFTSEKAANNIPDNEIKRFTDFLTNRLLLLGLYYGVNLSGTGLNYFLDKNSHSNESTYKFFITYLLVSIPEQLSTETDFIIENINCINTTNLGFFIGDSSRQTKLNRKTLKRLSPMEREYDVIFRSLANYEKRFITNICEFAKSKKMPAEASEHINYILHNSQKWK